MINIYIKDDNSFNNVMLYFQSIFFFFIILITSQILPYIFLKLIEKLTETNCIQYIKNFYINIIPSCIFASICIIKLIIIYKFGTNITDNDLYIIIFICIFSTYILIHSHFITIKSISAQIIACIIYLVTTMFIITPIISQTYLTITCEKYTCDHEYNDLLFPISYKCNIHDGRFLLVFDKTDIHIEQITQDTDIYQYITNTSLEEHFHNKDSVIFRLEIQVKNNTITKQTIYKPNGNKVKQINYKINNDNNILIKTFKKLN